MKIKRLIAPFVGILALVGVVAATPVSPTYQNLTLLGSLIVNGQVTVQGANLALAAADTAAMQQIPIVVGGINILSNGAKIRALTYLSGSIAAPPVDYYLTQTTCVVDNGSCFNAGTSGYFWHITPQTIWNAKWWGARQDVVKLLNTATNVTVTANSCAVQITSTQTGWGGFTAAHIGQRIAFTFAVSGSANNPTYWSSIASVQSTTNVTVAAPCPTLTSNAAQVVYVGHDDTAAQTNQTLGPVNAAITYLGTLLTQNDSGLPELDMGGLATGVYAAPINISQAITLRHASVVVLGADNLAVRSSGAIEVNGFYSALRESTVDSAYMPVNGIYSNSNGTLLISDSRAKNWMGFSAGALPVTFTGSSTAELIITSAWIDTCSSGASFGFACTLHVTGTTGSGLIQPGQSVTDSAGHIPAGTYITGYGDNQSFGKNGTYLVYNVNSSPAFGSSGSTEAMIAIGLDVAVSACSTSNQSTSLPSPGLISHTTPGNVLQKRTFIVGCFTHVNSGDPPTHIVLNKAPASAFTNASLPFYADSNGLYFGPSAGLTVVNFTTVQEQFSGIADNNYGASIYDDSGGGTQFKGRTNAFQGAAQYVVGPDGGDNEFVTVFGETNWGPAATVCCEIDGPSILVMDGANSTIFDSPNVGGIIQVFAINGGPNVTINDPQYSINTGSIVYAPSDQIWAYCEISCSASKLVTRPFRTNGQIFSSSNQQNAPNHIALTTGANGVWPGLTTQQLNLLPSLNAVLLPYNGLMGVPFGLDFGTSVIKNAENMLTLESGSYVFREPDCGNHFVFTNASTFTATFPPNIGTNISQAAVKSDCTISFLASNGTGGTAVAGTGVTLYVGGTSTSPISIAENRWYEAHCFANADAQHPFCTVSELP